jgi:VIT1/CCC1 family predicted Fe2+/Mn2+ transporter
MAENVFDRTKRFYAKYLPVGDRLGEMFYAVWMVVVSLGILGGTGFEGGAIAYVVFIAFGVNIVWGVIDGLTVMHSNMIEKARSEKVVYDLRANDDLASREAGAEALEEGITADLSPADKEKVLDLIASAEPGADPSNKRYRAQRDDWYYALGILAIDALLVIPLVVPLIFWPDPAQGLYFTRLVATAIFAVLGAAYARNLNRRRWVAALFLGTLCFSLFSLAFVAGW